jgi:hypothetical protein
MLTDRTLAGLLPWWLFGYLALAQLVCALVGWRQAARSLAQVVIGAPMVALGTVVVQQILPSLVCEILFVEYLLVILSQASVSLFGAAATQRTIVAVLVHGVMRPVFGLVALCIVRTGRRTSRASSFDGTED